MDNKTVYVVTLRGEGELRNHTRHLSEDLKRALMLVDDTSTVADLKKRAAPSLRDNLAGMLHKLAEGWFIQDRTKMGQVPRMVVPKQLHAVEGTEELDFTGIANHSVTGELQAGHAREIGSKATQEKKDIDAAQIKPDQDTVKVAELVRAEAEAKQAADAARLKAEKEAAEVRAQLEAAQARIESEVQAHAEVEARAKREAEATLHKVEQEAAEARTQLEAAQARMKIEAQARAEAELRAKQEAESARLKAEQKAAEARAQLEAAQARVEAEAKARSEAEARAKQEAEAARLKAEQEAAEARAQLEAAQARIEAEARARIEAETRAKQEAETALRKVEQEAAEARAQLEAAQARIAAEAKARAESEAKLKREAEAARIKAEQEAARLRMEAEAILREAARNETEAKSKLEAASGKSESGAKSAGKSTAGTASKPPAPTSGMPLPTASNTQPKSFFSKSGSSSSKSMIATVLFLDIVSYTKLSVSKQIELKKWFNNRIWGFLSEIEESTRIILDTGDGAAIGFLQHPEQAIEVALQFRQALMESRQQECPELQIRMGINLGPVNILQDMNGQSNMLGDGINDAQRIMSFAKPDHIYISRSYYDVISRLSGEYVKWLVYRGTEKDKHGRPYQVYEVTKGGGADSAKQVSIASGSVDLGPFTFSGANDAIEQAHPLQTEEVLNHDAEGDQPAADMGTIDDISKFLMADADAWAQPPEIESEDSKTIVEENPQPEIPAAIEAEAEATVVSEFDKASTEADMRKMAESQAKAWIDAEQRARELAAAQSVSVTEQTASQPEVHAKVQPAAKVPRPALPIMKIVTGLVLLLLVTVFSLPYVWPMHGYINGLEKKLSAQFGQPVQISEMKAAFLPLPKLELLNVSVGNSNGLKAAHVVLHFSISALFNQTKPLTSVQLDGLELRADSFAQSLSWLQAIGGDSQYPVQSIAVNNAHFGDPGLNLPSVSGIARLDEQGHFLEVEMTSEAKNLGISLHPQETQNQIAMNLKDASLPPFPGIKFDELNLKGNIGNNEIDFSSFDGQLFGGDISGKARLGWQNGWLLQGHATVKNLDLQQALPNLGIEGEMQGDAEFRMAGASLKKLAQAMNMDGNFRIKKSTFNHLDILEATRQSNPGKISGGRTRLDDLSGSIDAQGNSVSIHQLKFSSEVLAGSGAVNLSPDGNLSGQLTVELKVKPDRVALQLSGSVTEPLLSPAH